MRSASLVFVAPLALFASNVIAAGQISVLKVPMFGYGNGYPMEASIIAVNDDVTTMSLQCPAKSATDACYMYAQQTLTIGPSTYNLKFGEADDETGSFSGTQDCKLSATIAVDRSLSTTWTLGGQNGAPSITVSAAPASAVFAECDVSATGTDSEDNLSTQITYNPLGSRQSAGGGNLFDVAVVSGASLLTASAAQTTNLGPQTGAGATSTGAPQTTGASPTRSTASATATPTHTGQASRFGVEVALGAAAAGMAGLLAL
jgi:hypothetical protein